MAQRMPPLDRLDSSAKHEFLLPVKRINDGEDLNYFSSSLAYRSLMLWVFQLNRSMFPTKDNNGKATASTLTPPSSSSSLSQSIRSVRGILNALSDAVDRAPPSTGPRRFGNIAFRDWYKIVEDEAAGLLRSELASTLSLWDSQESKASASVYDELRAYLIGSFGSAQRLDYGTGHELSFLAFLGGLWKLDAFEDGSENAIVTAVIQPYLTLVRKLILTYTLEPAGSHGVWGLDDHSFAPYIFGSAQLAPAIDSSDPIVPVPTEGSFPTAPSPTSVTKKDVVADYKDSNMYFSAIQFIYDVKRGPFWEHSPVLFDISGIKDGWGKINKGMLKMYTAETLEKFPVVQHFPFGSLFRWEQDPHAVRHASSVHSQHQPSASPKPGAKGQDLPSSGAMGVGTAAPWAKQTSSSSVNMPQMQASTGVPTTRAPWAGGSVAAMSRSGVPSYGGTESMRPPGATSQSSPGSMPPSTMAPWARK